MDNRIPVTAILTALAFCAGASVVSAQYSANSALRNPGATTPTPKQAAKPPKTWQPAPQPAPAVRQLNPNPSCVTSPCNAPPIILRDPS